MRTLVQINFENKPLVVADIDKFDQFDDREVVTLFSAIYPGWSSYQILNGETLESKKIFCNAYDNGFYAEHGIDLCVNCGQREAKHYK